MTEVVLVSVITLLCGGTVNTTGSFRTSNKEAEELRIDCYEKYTNCAVKSDGKIMELKEFQNKCVKK